MAAVIRFLLSFSCLCGGLLSLFGTALFILDSRGFLIVQGKVSIYERILLIVVHAAVAFICFYLAHYIAKKKDLA